MVRRNHHEGDVQRIAALQEGSAAQSKNPEFELGIVLSYPRFRTDACCLGQHDPLHELDAAYSCRQGSAVPYLKYSRLDGDHALPCGRIIRVVDSNQVRISALCLVSSAPFFMSWEFVAPSQTSG